MSADENKISTKQKILDSAAVLFSEKGYNSASIAEICEMAGANIAAVNYHFRSKDELYRDVIQYTFEQAEALYPMEIESGATVETRLYQFVLSLLKRILSTESKGNFYHLVSKEMTEPTEASGSLIKEIIFKKRQRVKNLIQEIYNKPAGDELILRMTHSIVSQCLFLGMNQKGHLHHLKRKPLDYSDAASFSRHITDFSLAGIKCYDSHGQ